VRNVKLKPIKDRCSEQGHIFKEAKYIFGKKIPHSLYCVVCGAEFRDTESEYLWGDLISE